MRKLTTTVFALLIAAAIAPTADAQMRYSVTRYGGSRLDPAVNNYLSARYDYRLQVDMRFRSYRKWKECHTITWPGLQPACLASFDQYEPVLPGYPRYY